MYPLPALLTSLPLILFTTEEISGGTNEAAKDPKKAPRNLPSCFFISCFTDSVTLSINAHECSSDFMILTTLVISSFEINKANPFPALTAPFPFIFLSYLFIAFEVKMLTNPGKLSLAKGIAIFVSDFLTKNQKVHLFELFWIFELY